MEDQTLQTAEQSAEPVSTGADSATDSEGQHEQKTTFSEEQQAKVDEIIGEKTFKARQRERELEAQLQAERQAKAELESQIPAKQRPDVPPMPDPYEDSYREKMEARDRAIQQAAEFDADVKARNDAQQAEVNRQNIEQAQKWNDTVLAYQQRAVQLGITEQELQQLGDQVANFGVHENIVEFIIRDDQGPLITKYLAQNPTELDSLARTDPTMGLVQVATDVKSKASGLIVKPSDAPDPPELLKGSGMPPSRRGPSGATFE